MNEISVNNSFSENNYYQKYEYFDTLVEMIKQKLAISSRTEKIKLLITNKIFWCQKVDDKKSKRVITKYKGLLCEPDQSTRKGISEELRRAVEIFYQNDEYSRM